MSQQTQHPSLPLNMLTRFARSNLIKRLLSIMTIISIVLFGLVSKESTKDLKAHSTDHTCDLWEPANGKDVKTGADHPNEIPVSVELPFSTSISYTVLIQDDKIAFPNDPWPNCIKLDTKKRAWQLYLDRDGVYCYQVLDVDNRQPKNEFGILHIQDGERYNFVKFPIRNWGDVYRLEESEGTAELIIADKLPNKPEDKVLSRQVTITDQSGSTKSLKVNATSLITTTEIDVPPNSELEVTIGVTMTLTDGTVHSAWGSGILRAVDTGQLYSIDVWGGRAYLRDTTCEDFIQGERQGNDFGVQKIGVNNTISGIVASNFGDRWIFEGKKGELVKITMRNSDMNSLLELWDDGSGQRINVDSDFHYDGTAEILHVLPSGGQYSIIAKPYNVHNDSTRVSTGRYSLTVDRVIVPDIGEEVNWISFLDYNREVNDKFANSTANGYIFFGNKGDKVTSTIYDSSGMTPTLKLYSPQGKLMSTDMGGCCLSPEERYANFQISSLPDTGYYTIVVRRNRSTFDPYRLDLVNVQSVASYRPNSIKYGETQQQEILKNVSDRWSFQGNAGDDIEISMTSKFSSLDTALMLLTPTGEVIAANDDQRKCDNNDCGLSPTDSYIMYDSLPMTGTYIIVADRWRHDSIGSYEISLRRR